MSAGIRQRSVYRGTITLRGLFAICLCVLVLALVVWWSWRSMTTDYSQLAPADTFQRVFARPLPRGVTDLRVAGYGWVTGARVGMRFRITDAGLRDLLSNCFPESRRNFETLASSRLQSDWARAVGLREVQRIRRPEYYAFGSAPYGSGWYGWLAVDREQHFVFVIALL